MKLNAVGPVSMGCPTVLIGGLTAARAGNMAVCVGPSDIVTSDSMKVFIGGIRAARIAFTTAHSWQIFLGAITMLLA